MSTNYDLIATVDIDIINPVVDDVSVDSILIVGPLPAVAPTVAPKEFAVYNKLSDVTNAGWVASGTGADPVGIAARVAFAQKDKPRRIYIAPIQVVNQQAETAVATITRAMDYGGWYCVCPAGVASTQFQAIAEYIETQEKMFCYTETGVLASTNATPTVTGDYYRTIAVYGKENSAQAANAIPTENNYANVAFATEWLQFQSGSETAAFKVQRLISPSILSSTEIDHLVDKNVNYIIAVGSRIITMNGITIAGEWADIIRFRDWLKHDMQKRVVNLFLDTPKVPYTDSGIALVQNRMLESLKAGVDCGGIAPEEFDEDGNSIPSYVTSVPTAASIPAETKRTRKLYDCKFSARLAGAIHFAEITGSLTYSLV